MLSTCGSWAGYVEIYLSAKPMLDLEIVKSFGFLFELGLCVQASFGCVVL